MFIDKPNHTGKRLLVWALLILQVMPLSVRAAPTIPDTRFPGEQSIITPGASKVPIIQIAPPNDAKVSHNRFLYYNVDPQGQILNNSGLPSKTILAGEITGNPMLGNNHATLILNEVTSAIPSWLRGPIEIAGHRADLVIANPGGIHINGASFINVGGATLTTGTPAVGADGRLNVLDIQRGLIDIQGQTFDALGADSLRLLSRSLLLNAKLQANDLEVVAGANRINVASGAITPQSGSGVVPRLAVDIGVLGGMHAQRIYLVGTEAGVGVNSQGKLEAQVGDIILSSAGDLAINGGKLDAAWDVRADAGRDLTLKAADIQAGGDIDLAAGRNLIIGAKRVDAAATRVAGNTTNTVETVEHIGSVLEAGGDLYLTASLDPTLAVSSDTLSTWQSARSTAEQDLAGKAELAGTLKTQAEIAQADIDTSSLVELESRLNGLQYNWDSGWYCRGAWYNQDCVSPWEYPVLQERASAEHTRLAPKQALVATWKAAEAAVTQSQANLDAILSQQEAFKGGRIEIDSSGLVAGGNLSASASEIALQGRNDSKLVRDVSVSHHRSCNGFLGLSCKNWTETTTLESYDETLKPGELDAVGDIALFAQGNRDTNAAYIPETGNVLLLGAAVRSDLGQISLSAANDLEIEAAQLRHALLKEVRTRIVDSWLFAPVSTTTRLAIDSEESDLSQGSLVTGDSLQLQAGRDLLGRGAALSADHDIQLIAGRDLDLLEARDQVSREMIRESKKTGLFKTGLIGLTLGTTSTRQAREETLDTAVSTQVASIDGNLGLLAGRDLSVQGTDLLAGGDIDLIGDNVAILAAANVYDRKDSVQTRTSGLTLALKGGIVDVVEAAWQAGRRAEETSDGRLKAAYAAKTGYHLYQAYAAAGQLADFGPSLEGLGQGFNTLLNGNLDAKADSGGINLELTIGGSASSSENRLHEVTYGASHLDSGGDTTVVARAGVEGGGNLAIVGSQLTAHDLTLSAGNDLTLGHAQQTRTASEKSSNTAAAVGIGFGTDGLYFTVSGQVGNAKGEALKEDNGETRLHADNRLTLLSGGDALLKGAIANAQRIEADIGGDLTLQSLQDSERYRYKSSNAGGSLQIGYGKFNASVNAGQQNIRNDYRSVIEQTGLFAGDGGYDIQVGGHTQLDGAAIAGGEASLNRLGTQSIGYSDLTNYEQTTVSGYSFGLGTGAGSNYVSPVANLNSNRASVTQAVISPGTVEVRDLAGKDRERLEADSASRQSRIASLQSDVEKLKAQKAQQEQGNTWLLAYWKGLLAYAKANPTALWFWGGVSMGNLIPGLEQSIAAAETDPATFQARIDQANGQIADSQATLALTDGLIGEFQAIDTLTGRDLATANPALTSRFDANRTRAHLEAMTVFSETAMRVVGDVYKPLTDAVAQAEAGLRQAQKSGDGTAIQAATARLAGAREALDAKAGERALAHGLVGGLTAALGGVDPATGFLGGAAGKLASTELGTLIDGSDWARSNPVAAELLKTAIATSAGMVAGGATGGMVASQGDRFNRQLHMATYDKLKGQCGGKANTIECRTLQRMTGVNSQMRDDLALPQDEVVANYDAQGKVVSYTLVDKASNQAWMIMEPVEFEVYRELGYQIRADYQTYSQQELDRASYAFYVANYDLKRAAEHLSYDWLNKDAMRDAALSVVAGGVASKLVGKLVGLAGQTTTTLWKSASQLSTSEANRLLKQSLPSGTKITGNGSADAVNAAEVLKGFDAPLVAGTKVVDLVATQPTQFVRVYATDSKSGQVGTWVMRAEDIAGLSAQQIASKFSLPQVPNMMTDVAVPRGIKMQGSVANNILLGTNGGGGGVQFQIQSVPNDPIAFSQWFGNARALK